MANRVLDLEALEVSLVGKPANKRKFLLFKSEGGEKMAEVNKNVEDEKVVDEEGGNKESTEENIEKQEEEIEGLSEEAENAVIGALRMLQEYEEELPESVFSPLIELLGGVDSAMDLVTGNVNKSTIEKQLDELPEEVQSKVTEIFKEKEKLEKELKEQKDKELLRKFVDQAKDDFNNLPLSAEKLGQVLKNINGNTDEDSYNALVSLLKSVNEIIKDNEGIFKEIGSNQDSESYTTWEKIEKQAESLIEKSEGMTKEKAISKILEDNPKLYNEYLKEKRKGGQ